MSHLTVVGLLRVLVLLVSVFDLLMAYKFFIGAALWIHESSEEKAEHTDASLGYLQDHCALGSIFSQVLVKYCMSISSF